MSSTTTSQRLRGIVLGCLAAACAVASAAAMSPVATQSGAVQGLMQDGIAVFRGLPYAASPEGDLRWRAPQPAPKRSATFDATVFGPVCPQSQQGSAYLKGLPMSEDCLRLNVYAPAAALAGGARLPVMLWIHGGSYRWGAGSWPGNEPFVLAKQGVTVVTINYRLGRLGLVRPPGAVGLDGGRAARQLCADGSNRRAALGARQHRRVRR